MSLQLVDSNSCKTFKTNGSPLKSSIGIVGTDRYHYCIIGVFRLEAGATAYIGDGKKVCILNTVNQIIVCVLLTVHRYIIL